MPLTEGMQAIHSQLVVIGGGAAGFFGAIRAAAANPGATVTILERGANVLEKVRISGGGRCNVTHACFEPAELVKFYPRGGKALRGPFHHFACGDTIAWFAERGVETKIEADGRIFPITDNSQTIIDCLLGEARRLGVRVLTKRRVSQIEPPTETTPWTVTTAAETFTADRLLVTPGSNPGIWRMLAELGHSIVEPVPSLFTFNIQDERLAELAGLSVPWAALRIDGQRLAAEGPLLITHWGLSGPAVLRLSAWGARELAALDYRFFLHVNWLNQRTDDVAEQLAELRTHWSRRQLAAHAAFELPLRLWKKLVAAAAIPENNQWAQLTKQQAQALARQLTDARFAVAGKSTFKEEFVTAGGVDLREVDFRTFASKLHPTLFLAGEVLDIDAITGGFNFQAAWTGGYIAGESIALD